MEEKKQEEVYANALTVSNTFFDFTLDFKRECIYENEEGKQEKEVVEVAKIRISPQMAKALNRLLDGNLNKYEADFGTIPEFK